VLHEKALVLALGVSETLKFSHRGQIRFGQPPDENAVGHLLAPTGKHERMDAERSRHVLDQHARLLGELDGLQLELELVSLDSTGTRFRHRDLP